MEVNVSRFKELLSMSPTEYPPEVSAEIADNRRKQAFDDIIFHMEDASKADAYELEDYEYILTNLPMLLENLQATEKIQQVFVNMHSVSKRKRLL